MYFSLIMYLGSNNVYFRYLKKCAFYSTKMFITIMIFLVNKLSDNFIYNP